MTTTLTLRDPGGNVRVTLAAPAEPETLLRAAWGLVEGDMLVVLALDNETWDLAILWANRTRAVQTLGVLAGHVPEDHISRNRASMVEAAWLDLVDDGWTVV